MSRVALATALRALAPAVVAVIEAAAATLEDAPAWVALRDVELPRKSVRAAVRAGELEVRKVGREYFVRRDHLETWIDSRTSRPAPPKRQSTSGAATRAIARAGGHLRALGRAS